MLLLLLAVPPCFAGISCTGASQNLTEGECGAWVSFFDALAGTNWTSCSHFRTDPCTCGQLTGRIECTDSHITTISLTSNNMQGTLPEEIGQFSHLATLEAYTNAIQGTLPSALGELSALEILALESNALTGTLPTNLARLEKLEIMDIEVNHLTGSIPSSFTTMAALRRIDLLNNQLSGLLPPLNFSQYTEGCWLSGNDFRCPLPPCARTNCTGFGHFPPSPPTCK